MRTVLSSHVLCFCPNFHCSIGEGWKETGLGVRIILNDPGGLRKIQILWVQLENFLSIFLHPTNPIFLPSHALSFCPNFQGSAREGQKEMVPGMKIVLSSPRGGLGIFSVFMAAGKKKIIFNNQPLRQWMHQWGGVAPHVPSRVSCVDYWRGGDALLASRAIGKGRQAIYSRALARCWKTREGTRIRESFVRNCNSLIFIENCR